MENKNGEAVDNNSSAAEDTQAVEQDEGAAAHIEPDWKELLRLEQERSNKLSEERDNYKAGMLSAKSREKNLKREQAAEDDEGEDKIKKAVREALEPVISTIQGSKVDQILSSVVTDPSKREYVKSLLQNRIQRTGTSDEAVRSDIEAALALANASKFAKENEELRRMNDNRTYIPPNSGGTGGSDKGVERKAHKWTPEQERALEQRALANGLTDVEKYKEIAWKQAQSGTAFEARKKYI